MFGQEIHEHAHTRRQDSARRIDGADRWSVMMIVSGEQCGQPAYPDIRPDQYLRHADDADTGERQPAQGFGAVGLYRAADTHALQTVRAIELPDIETAACCDAKTDMTLKVVWRYRHAMSFEISR